MTDVPLFDITPRRPLLVGDAVVVETIIGPKEATVSSAPRDGEVRVRMKRPRRRGQGFVLQRPVTVAVGRVRHAEG